MMRYYIPLLLHVSMLWLGLEQLGAQNPRYIPIDHSKGQVDTVTFTRQRVISEQSMVSRFNTLFRTLHGRHERLTFTNTRHLNGFIYDSVNQIFYGQLRHKNVLRSDAHVFAWHPYWMQNEYQYYPYGLISSLCFFAYDLDPYSGSYNNPDAIDRWLTTPLMDSAKMHDIKVLLSVTSYGEQRNQIFLNNKAAQVALGDSLRVLLRTRSAQGIDLDFSGVPAHLSGHFVAFIKSLRSKLGDTTIISLHLPASINMMPEAYDLQSLNTLINTFIVQSYEHEKEPRTKGAIAPLYTLQKKQYSMASAVEHCLRSGLKSKQVIAVLPLYGTLWKGNEAQDLPYEDIIALYEKNHKPALQPWTESMYIGLAPHDTLWYEGAASLQQKFLWAKQHGLGIGLWGLGYDGGRKEIWEAVATQYAVPPVTLMQPAVIDQGLTYSIMSKLQQYRKQIGIGFLILMVFFMLGMLLSLLDWRVREMFFRSHLTAILLTSFIICTFMLFLYIVSGGVYSLEHIILPLLIGALGGATLVYGIMRWYTSYRNKMP